MTAYNSVDGSPATQNRRLLNGILKRDWGFTGFVISDAAATGGATVLHMTEPNTPIAAQHAFEAGPRRRLSVVVRPAAAVPGCVPARADRAGDHRRGGRARAARQVRAGTVRAAYVDRGRGRAIERPCRSSRARARSRARASIVLLRNERGDAAAGEVAAVDRRHWRRRRPRRGSAATAVRGRRCLDSRRHPAKLGAGQRASTRQGQDGRCASSCRSDGVPASPERPESRAGLSGEYFDNNRLEGTPRLTRIDPRIDFRWTLNSPGRGIPFDWYSVRWTGTIIAPPAGVRRIGVEGNDGYRLYLDDALIDRQLGEAVVRHAHRRRRAWPRGSSHRDPARVLREHRHTRGSSCSGTPGVRRRQREQRIARRRRARAQQRRRRSSSRASKKASSAIARSSACRAGRRS